MSVNVLELDKAHTMRSSMDLSKREVEDILKYLEEHDEDVGAFGVVSKKYNISDMTIGLLVIKRLCV